MVELVERMTGHLEDEIETELAPLTVEFNPAPKESSAARELASDDVYKSPKAVNSGEFQTEFEQWRAKRSGESSPLTE